MQIETIKAVYFSATETTRKIVTCNVEAAARRMDTACGYVEFTRPAEREAALRFRAGKLVVFGTPVYGGRVLDAILKV